MPLCLRGKSLRFGSARLRRRRSSFFNQTPANDETLNLIRAFVNLRDLGVAHVLLNRIILAVAVAAEELFAAQRSMRERGEELFGIYHSHPRSSEPVPSATDVRLAYYPSAIYFIIGLSADHEALRAFRISERDGRWERIDYAIADD